MIVPLKSVHAISTATTITLRPHCLNEYREDNEILKREMDAIGVQHLENLQEDMIGIEQHAASVSEIRCPNFSVENPQTLKTPNLTVGDIVDLDIVVENPDLKQLSRVRAWLSYDPNILHGDQITISEEFPVITPGESDFSESEGYAKIEGSAEGRGPDDLQILVARVQFTVRKTTPGGTVINFFDVQSGGHTTAVTVKGEEEEYLFNREPGALHVVFTEEAPVPVAAKTPTPATAPTSNTIPTAPVVPAAPAGELLSDGDVCITDQQCRSSHCVSGICQGAIPLPEKAACGTDAQCASGQCIDNACTAPTTAPASPSTPTVSTLAAAGGACQSNTDCESNLCIANICIPSLDSQRKDTPAQVAPPAAPTAADNSAFSLLQVQNIRITTEGSSIYLGWEGLNSSQLKAYNIYYGTTTGRYIQRKTVEASTKSLAIRSLPIGTTYYFAVRAVNLADQESAFSQEVAVTVGDPKTSTAPLSAGSIPDDGPGKNPVQGSVTGNGGSVPGATGIPTIALTLALLSAVIGTGFASRRQMIAVADTPQA
jgi:hypothetical protein